MNGVVVKFPCDNKRQSPIAGRLGLKTQMPGCAATVSNMAEASGGLRAGGFIQRGVGKK